MQFKIGSRLVNKQFKCQLFLSLEGEKCIALTGYVDFTISAFVTNQKFHRKQNCQSKILFSYNCKYRT